MSNVKPYGTTKRETLVDDIALIVTSEDAIKELSNGLYNRLGAILLDDLRSGGQGAYSSDEITNVFNSRLDQLEKDIKERHNITSLPTVYRTAKSVFLRAATHLVSIKDDDGEIKPKTALEKDIKQTIEASFYLEAGGSHKVGIGIPTSSLTPVSLNKEGNNKFKDLHKFMETHYPQLKDQVLDLWEIFDNMSKGQ